jgi:phage terminase large subunit
MSPQPAAIELADWAEALWTPSRYKALWGGRGGGKSRSVATALVLQAAQSPERILCAREVQKSIKDSVKRLLDDEIQRLGLGGFFSSTEAEIRGINGSLFIFAGLRHNVAGIKSLEGVTKVWVEEAQTISQASLNTLVPTIRAPGSELWFTWNPDKATDPIDKTFRGEHGAPPDSIVINVNHDRNPWFPDVLRAEMEFDRGRDFDKYLHVWQGEYNLNSEARVFKNWTVEEFDSPGDAIFRFGADWGFSTDPTVLIRCWVKDRTLFVDREVWAIGCEIDETPDLFDRVQGARKWTITADSARPETISYMRRHGFKIVSAVKGPGSLEDGVQFLKSFDIMVHPKCQHVIDELTHYAFKLDPLTQEILPVLEDKNNHTIDALRYALEALRRVQPLPNKITARDPTDLWGRANQGADDWKVL